MSTHCVDVGASDFVQVVIEGSKKAPVLVDFWAPWCAPCRALTPVLEKLAAEYKGKFTLAKVNSDENQALASRFGVRGIPNVKAFVDGELVDEFSGAIPESDVRAFLERVIPSPAEELRRQAVELYQRTHDGAQALALLERAAGIEPRNDMIAMDRAQILLEARRFDEARSQLDALTPLAQMDERAVSLKAQIEIAAAAAAAPDAGPLRARIAADAGDLDARLKLANLCIVEQDYSAALEQLLEIVRRDRKFQDDAARKTMLQVFSLLGNEGELVSEYRKRLAGALY